MIRAAILLPLALAVTPSIADPAQGTTHVGVDGRVYRVTVKGSEVTVASKRTMVGYSIEERDRQRAAALKATGCRVIDEMQDGDARVHGKLDCGAPAGP